MAKSKIFNSSLTRAAIEDIDRLYLDARVRPGRNPPKARADSLDLYWGHPGPQQTKGSRSFHYPAHFCLGAKGKIWALCLLQSHLGRQYQLQKVFVTAILTTARSEDYDSDKLADDLTGLISPTIPETLPKPDRDESQLSKPDRERLHAVTADRLVRVVATYFSKAFSEHQGNVGTDLHALIADIERSRPSAISRVSQLYCALCDALGLSPFEDKEESVAAVNTCLTPDNANCLSYIEDGIFVGLKVETPRDSAPRYLPITDQEVGKSAYNIFHELTAFDYRLQIVAGEPFAGKKTQLGNALRKIATRTGGKMCCPTDNKAFPWLPVLALSAKNKFYNDLIDRILGFMEEYREVLHPTGPTERPFYWSQANTEPRRFDANLGLMALRKFAGQPALFILTDVEAFHPDPMRIVVRDIGIRRLINALMEISPLSRMVVTTGLSEDALKGLEPVMPPFRIELIPKPDGTQLEKLIKDASLYEKVEARFGEKIHLPMAGDVMLGIATLVKLKEGLPEDAYSDIEAMLEADAASLPEFHNKIFVRLLEALDDRGLLPCIMLLAFSEDGLTDATLRKLTEMWQAFSPLPPPVDDPVAAFEGIQRIAGRAFLISKNLTPHDLDEYGCFRPKEEYERLWEFEAEIAEHIMRASQTDGWLGKAQIANRLIAIEARRQAQNKKMFMHTSHTADSSIESRRDIQSYISLLASLPPESLVRTQADFPGVPLRMREADIFTLEIARFDSVIALRFAALCLLKMDIDRDYRLTMITDEDPLRLELYLLLFQLPGVRYFVTKKPLELGTSLPSHLRTVFQNGEILELLESLAIAAFHSQRTDIVNQVVLLAEQLAADMPWPSVCDTLARIWCSRIDAAIARGGIADNSNHEETDELLDSYIREHRRLASLPEANELTEVHFVDKRREISALIRLFSRKAELAAISVSDRAVAADLYQMVEKLQRGLSRKSDNADELTMNGRAARKYIRFLARDPEFRCRAVAIEASTLPLSVEASGARDKLKQLIDINIARLKRFSGGDRIGVLLDMARYAYTRAELGEALKYAEAAYERATSGNLSLLGKTDVLAVSVDLGILFLEKLAHERSQTGRIEVREERETDGGLKLHIARVRDQIALLEWICVRMKFKPYEAIADFLISRLAKAEIALQPHFTSDFLVDITTHRKLMLRSAAKAKATSSLVKDLSFAPLVDMILRE